MQRTEKDPMEEHYLRIRTIREGNAVKRCHTVPCFGEYNVGMHSANALSLLLVFNPDASPALMKAVLWHDIAERFLGDLPATAKTNFSDLRIAYEAAEKRIEKLLKLDQQLTKYEIIWLKAVDALELWIWCQEQLYMGNQFVRTWLILLSNILTKYEMPDSIKKFISSYKQERLSEVVFYGQTNHISV